jgi:acetyl esterase/lipase
MNRSASTPPGLALLLAVLALPLAAQHDVQVLPRDAPAPDLAGLPALPKVMALSPRDSLLFADRVSVGQGAAPAGAGDTGGQLVKVVVPASLTGTTIGEVIEYLVPSSYQHGVPIPLLVAWHGFGTSAANVSKQTTLDEECEARGWAYLSVTGLDDKLFGSLPSQQNVAAAIAWMQAKVAIDPDRIWMAGFSMGAGCVTSFAARHRDPDGLTIAAVGLVSGSYDWTQTWHLGPEMRPWLENPWNFGAPPALAPFAYQRCSGLYHDPASYPPVPGTHVDHLAMAQNLHATPAYVTWDSGDTLTELPPQSARIVDLLEGLGGTVVSLTVSGTTDPATGAPATHSWAVLDEDALCDFLAQHPAQRRPATLVAQVDERRPASWLTLEPAAADAFAWARGQADATGGVLAVTDVSGAARALAAPWAAAPWTLSIAQSPQAAGLALGVTGADPPAGWARQAGAPVTAFDFDPGGDGLLLPAGADGAWEVQARAWDAGLSLLPDPAPLGAAITLDVDAPPGATVAWILGGISAAEIPFGTGHLLLVAPSPPFMAFPLALDASGDAEVSTWLSHDASLSGAWILLQAALQGSAGGLTGTSNPFRFDVE